MKKIKEKKKTRRIRMKGLKKRVHSPHELREKCGSEFLMTIEKKRA